MLAPIFTIHPAMGAEIITSAFVVVVIGGLGSFWGAVLAALIVGVTKGAVTALTKGLAVEYAPFKVRVNAISPGYVETAITDRMLRLPQARKMLTDKTPMGRLGNPEDMTGAAVFFASDDSALITGSVLDVEQFPVGAPGTW